MTPRHLMLAILLIALVFVATGCDGSSEATSTIARSFIDGDRIDMDWVRTWVDRARFECVASSNGLCRIVVFVTECPGGACRTRILRDFVLEAGGVADLVGLPPGFRYCLSHGETPLAPACSNL